MGRTAQNGLDASALIAGRYHLIERLGTGGMAEVWRAFDDVLDRSVAVKVLSARHAGEQSFRERLRQEALAAAQLVHPNITGIFDFGEAQITSQLTVPYVVMELNDGESLAARINRLGALPWAEAVTIAAEVASALALAHLRGVVHRDITPANVMLTATGAKVVDFGISAIVGQRDCTADGSLLGTPAYLAPERLVGGQVNTASDLYALGLLLYRALTGRLPWPAENTTEALRAHLYADPEPLPDLQGLPPVVGELCLRLLVKDPAARPGAIEVSRGLATLVSKRRVNQGSIPSIVRGVAAAVPAGAATPSGRGAWASSPGRTRAMSRYRVRALSLGWIRGFGLIPGWTLRRGGLSGLRRGWPQLPRLTLRPQAMALFTVVLLSVGGLSWAVTRQVPAVEQAQAANDRLAPEPANPGSCLVRYQLKRDSGREFEALLTVATTTELTNSPWWVRFFYPGSQHLARGLKLIKQKGRKVVGTGRGSRQTFNLRGDYQGANPLPLAFTLDGQSCRAEVLSDPADRNVR